MPPRKTKAQQEEEARLAAWEKALIGVPENAKQQIYLFTEEKEALEAQLGRAAKAPELVALQRKYPLYVAWQSGAYLRAQQAVVQEEANASVLATEKGFEIKMLYDRKLPTSEILPFIVCSNVEITEKANDGTDLYSAQAKKSMKTFFAAQSERGSDDIYSSAAIAPYVDDETGTASVEGTAFCSIHPDLMAEGAVKDEYNATDAISEIPIYIVVISKAAGGHASMIVFFGGRLYSLGLGYSGGAKMQRRTEKYEAAERKAAKVKAGGDLSSVINDAAFYSPDFLIKPAAVTSKGTPYSFKVADIGVLKKSHLTKIQTILNAGKQGGGWFSGDASWKAQFQVELAGGRSNFQFDSYVIDIGTPYSMVATRFSSGSAINCTSFLEYLFKERLSCPAFSTFLVSRPANCQSKAFKDPSQWVKEFLRKYQRNEAIGEDLLLKFSWEQGWGNYFATCTIDYCARNRRWGGKRTRKGKKGSKTRRLRKH